MRMRVDAVITWVDGSDSVWRQKRSLHEVGNLSSTLATSNVEGRFRNNGELKYLLRSLDRFWPFEGNIYIVTDKQTPDFLSKHPRIRIIDHTQILPAHHLPTFSSRAIESSLHKIPGIAEHFVAFNDDLFLTRPVTISDFFSSIGYGIRAYLSDEALPEVNEKDNLSGHNDALNAKLWMLEHQGRSSIDHIQEHYPKGVIQSLMAHLESVHPRMFDEVRSEKFRKIGGQSVLANVYPDWCITNGYGDIRTKECEYLFTHDIEENNLQDHLKSLLNDKLCLCINDTTDNRQDIHVMQRRLHEHLETLFPRPCQYEAKPIIHPDASVALAI
jgi:hypothetical protein